MLATASGIGSGFIAPVKRARVIGQLEMRRATATAAERRQQISVRRNRLEAGVSVREKLALHFHTFSKLNKL